MAWDRYNTDYHLTSRGWETDEPPPADRVETWNRSVHQQSGWSKEYIDWTCIWADSDVPRAERDALRKKHQTFMGTDGRSGDTITSVGDPL